MRSVFDDPDKVVISNDDAGLQKLIQHYADVLKKVRKERGLSQLNLANLSGTSQKIVCEIERGGNFQMSTYARLCKAMDVEPRVTLRRASCGRPRKSIAKV